MRAAVKVTRDEMTAGDLRTADGPDCVKRDHLLKSLR